MDFGGYFRERRYYESPLAVKAYRGARRAAAFAGLQVVLKTFYSPIPEVDRLPADVFDRRSPMAGVDFDLDRQLAFVTERIGPAAKAFRPPGEAADPGTYAWQNPSYGALDATLLYGMVRHLRPRRIVELGSGHSTLVMAQAARDNAREGHETLLEAYDPYAAVVTPELPGLAALHGANAQDLGADAFAHLGDGDILFVDTTHTVKLGSDVNHILLDIVPALAPGVVVHFHDIFLPYEYPRRWIEDYALYWAEQYLVQAFLALNREFEVLASAHALWRDRRQALGDALPPGATDGDGSALWLRRRSAPAAI